MKFKPPINANYCVTIVKIKNVLDLTNCDNIKGTFIFGNHVIIGNTIKDGDIGVYFPPETQLSHDYASKNNLYRHNNLNKDLDQKGYIEDNRRVRTMRMRGHESCGLFMPLSSLSHFIDISKLKVGDEFDELKGTKICNKYIVKKAKPLTGSKQQRKRIKQSKSIEGQFRFHPDTLQFAKHAHLFQPDDLISITYKLHGTSVVISNVLCKKPIHWFHNFLKKLKVPIIDTQYDNLYSSRKVIKNDELLQKWEGTVDHFYGADIWGMANQRMLEYLEDGLTIYAEIVGYLPDGTPIQDAWDYGCNHGEFEVYVYRITYTNISGKVFEFSAKQVKDWCFERRIKSVPELYYGNLVDLFSEMDYEKDKSFHELLVFILREKFLEQDCFMCKNKVPAEGIVIRKESNRFEAYKLKSFRFLKKETEMLDKGTFDIEEQN